MTLDLVSFLQLQCVDYYLSSKHYYNLIVTQTEVLNVNYFFFLLVVVEYAIEQHSGCIQKLVFLLTQLISGQLWCTSLKQSYTH